MKAKPDIVDPPAAGVTPEALSVVTARVAVGAAADAAEAGAGAGVGAGKRGVGGPNRVGGPGTAVVVVVAGTVVVVPEGTVVVVVPEGIVVVVVTAAVVVVVTGEHVVGIVTVVEAFVRYPLRNSVETLSVSTLPASATGTMKLLELVAGEWAKVKACE